MDLLVILLVAQRLIYLSIFYHYIFMKPLLECVPNFSEGRDSQVIEAIAASIREVSGVQLLHVDPGHDAHRTVMTFAGDPEAVIEAAFRAIQTACKLIDMQVHEGEHPRMGATDVCPLVPVSGLDMEDAKRYADRLARRVGEELQVPVYLYEQNASAPHRRNLAHIRSGEYEGFRTKISEEEWKPDYGPASFQPKCGQTVIGARPFLVAYNVNLESQDVALAKEIAREIRESGRVVRIDGEKVRKPGLLKGVKAIGWWMEAYGLVQVSTNITDLRFTQVHEVFEAVKSLAAKYGVEVKESELIGLLPKAALMVAGLFYMGETKPLDVNTQTNDSKERQILQKAVEKLGLDFRGDFKIDQRVVEYLLDN